MLVPEDLLYTSSHEWVRLTNERCEVGITDFAQDALGDIVFIEQPTLGRVVTEGEMIGEIESTKSVSEIYAPVPGTVTAVNDQLADHPEFINEDPYGNGWLFALETTSGRSEGLLSPSDYQALQSDS